jgi:Amt family ammonium transporter
MNFKAWMLFVPLWSTFVYSIGCFSLWGGGWLTSLGAIDYSGGYVIHLAAGVSGFVAAAVVGPRLASDKRDFPPNNMIMALAGAGILWLGWNGFNGGDPFFANADASAAVLNTNISTAVALLVWMIADYIVLKHISAVSMINGMIAGLVAITPCAGWVSGYGAILVGMATIVPWLSITFLSRWSVMKKVDDTFSVFHTHGVAGLVGGLMAGLVSDPQMFEWLGANAKTPGIAYTGALFGNPHLLLVQLGAAGFIVALNVVGTFAILKAIALFVPLRSSEDDMHAGDLAIHGMDPIPGVPATAAAPVRAETAA